jgi:WD40 repeat protein
MAFDRTGKVLVLGHQTGMLVRWSVSEHKVKQAIQAHKEGSAIRAVATLDDGGVVATAAEGDSTVRLWKDWKQMPPGGLSGGGGINALAFTPDGGLLAAARNDGHVTAWRTDKWKQAGGGHADGAIEALVFSVDGSTLRTAHAGAGGLMTWAVKNNTLAEGRAIDGWNGGPARAVDPTGTWAVAVDRLHPLQGKQGGVDLAPVAGIAFSPTGDTIAIGRPDGKIDVWYVPGLAGVE